MYIHERPLQVKLAIAILIVAALLTSALSGVVGMAGGIALLGVMAAVMPANVVVPLHGVVQLCSNFTRATLMLKRVRWRIFWFYSGPVIAGTAAARWVHPGTALEWFNPLIGGFILVFIVWRRFMPRLGRLPVWTFAPLGLVTGFLSLFIGATGPLVAPFFLRDDMEPDEIVATKGCIQIVTHVMKIPAFLSMNFNYLEHVKILAILLACVIVGTVIGNRILARLSKKTFTILFETVLAGVAAYLLAVYFT
jgi:uncharacterized membrane protein YfcA